MSNLNVCRVCLATDNIKLYRIINPKLFAGYEIVTGTKIKTLDGLPEYVCSYCAAMLLKYKAFKEKCCHTQDILRYLLAQKLMLTANDIQNVNQHFNLYPYTIDKTIEINVPNIKEETAIENEESEIKEEAEKLEIDFQSGVKDEFHDDGLSLGSDSEEVKYDINELDVEVVVLSKRQQIEEIEARKSSYNYVNSCYKCDQCYKGFITDATFKNHMNKHDPAKGDHECEVCRSRWSDARSLRAHVATHERKYICKVCDFVSRSIHRAKEHNKWHNGATFDCKICGARFAKSTSHLTHMRLQHPTDNSCEICGESFLGEFGLNMHKKKAHNGAKPSKVLTMITCDSCGANFRNKDAIRRHLDIAGGGQCDTSLRVCTHCGINCDNDEALSKHTRKEHSLTSCFECKKSFTTERSYSVHVQRVHLGIKMKQVFKPSIRKIESVICEVCGKRCNTKSSLINHQRIHTGEKPYQCRQCPKKFGVLQRLQIHVRTHTGESPYKCEHCPKAFKHKAALNRHLRVHTGIKPYVCPQCGKAFSQSNSMKLHVNTVHLKLPAPYRNRKKI